MTSESPRHDDVVGQSVLTVWDSKTLKLTTELQQFPTEEKPVPQFTKVVAPLYQRVLSSILDHLLDKLQFCMATTLMFCASHSCIMSVWDDQISQRHDHSTFFARLAAVTGTLGIVLVLELVLRVHLREVKRRKEKGPYDPVMDEKLALAKSPAPASTKVRIYQLDYVKLLVNILICLHHHWDQSRPDEQVDDWFRDWRWVFANIIEPWMMQAVSFSSGFGTSLVFNEKVAWQWLKLVAGYFLVQLGYAVEINLNHIEKGDIPWKFNTWHGVVGRVIFPYFHLWYIWCLFSWKLLSHYWIRLRYPFTLALMLALCNGFNMVKETGDGVKPFQYQRILGYFPYFVAGLLLKNDKTLTGLLLQLISDPVIKTWSWMMIALSIWISVYESGANLQVYIMTMTVNYGLEPDHSLSMESNFMWQRFFVFPVAFINILCVNAVMPACDSTLRRAGSRTLGPYVLHQMVRIIMDTILPSNIMDDWKIKHVIPLLIVYWGSIFTLYLPQVHAYTQYLLLPPLDWMGMLCKPGFIKT